MKELLELIKALKFQTHKTGDFVKVGEVKSLPEQEFNTRFRNKLEGKKTDSHVYAEVVPVKIPSFSGGFEAWINIFIHDNLRNPILFLKDLKAELALRANNHKNVFSLGQEPSLRLDELIKWYEDMIDFLGGLRFASDLVEISIVSLKALEPRFVLYRAGGGSGNISDAVLNIVINFVDELSFLRYLEKQLERSPNFKLNDASASSLSERIKLLSMGDREDRDLASSLIGLHPELKPREGMVLTGFMDPARLLEIVGWLGMLNRKMGVIAGTEILDAYYASQMQGYAAIELDGVKPKFIEDEILSLEPPFVLRDEWNILQAILLAHESAQFLLRRGATDSADLTEELALFMEVDLSLWAALSPAQRLGGEQLAAHYDAIDEAAPGAKRLAASIQRLNGALKGSSK
jgi:hypothetical protein